MRWISGLLASLLLASLPTIDKLDSQLPGSTNEMAIARIHPLR